MAEDISEEEAEFQIAFYESVHKKTPTDVAVIELLAQLYTLLGRIDEGLAMDELFVELEPENPTGHYNLACSYALKARHGEAIEELDKAVDLGYRDLSWMMQDSDLLDLQVMPGFLEVVKKLKAKLP